MTLADAVPPPFSVGALLHGWEFVPLVIIPVLIIGALYLVGYRRVRLQPRPVFPRYRAWCFIGSLVAVVVAVDGPMDLYSDVDLSVHMTQHLVLLYIVAPLAVLGAPVTVALRATTPAGRSKYLLPTLHSRAVHMLSNPWFVTVFYAADIIGTHFTPFYNLSLYHQHIHDLEHLSYVVVGILLWAVILGVDPVRAKPSPPQRILVVLLLMPVMAVTSLVFILATRPLYPYYPALPAPWGGHAFAMSSQALAGAIMWIPSALVSLFAVMYISVEWFRADEARQRRVEALEDARERASS